MNEKDSSFLQTPDRKFLEYDFIEQRILVLNSGYVGFTLPINQRCYFGPNSKLKGKRIVGIDLFPDAPVIFNYNGIQLFGSNIYGFLTLSIVDMNGEEAIKDYPLKGLSVQNSFNKTRRFNVIPNMEESFVIPTQIVVSAGTVGIGFNFYTTNQ